MPIAILHTSAQCALAMSKTRRSIERGNKARLPRRRHWCVSRASSSSVGGREDQDGVVSAAGDDDAKTTAHRSSRRIALGGLITAPMVLPGIISSASLVSASAGPASAASELESEVTSKVFFDFAVDGQPVGRVVVGVFGKANPVAAARFATLAKGVQGLSYKRTEVNAIEYNGRGKRQTTTATTSPITTAFGQQICNLHPKLRLRHTCMPPIFLFLFWPFFWQNKVSVSMIQTPDVRFAMRASTLRT